MFYDPAELSSFALHTKYTCYYVCDILKMFRLRNLQKIGFEFFGGVALFLSKVLVAPPARSFLRHYVIKVWNLQFIHSKRDIFCIDCDISGNTICQAQEKIDFKYVPLARYVLGQYEVY